MDTQQVVLNDEPVELFKILKFEGVYMSGGEAKNAIEAGMVSLNGQIETRKRKKVYRGDKIETAGYCLHVI